MLVNENAPSPPGYIDRLRDFIAKIFGSPGRAPQRGEPVVAGGDPTPGRPADKTVRVIAAGGAVATA